MNDKSTFCLSFVKKSEGLSQIFGGKLFQFEAIVFTPQALRAVGVLFSAMVSRWAGGWMGDGKKCVQAVSQKP